MCTFIPLTVTSNFQKLVLICLNIGFLISADAQSYLKRNVLPDNTVNQKIQRFSNGDLLIGHSASQNNMGEDTKTLILTRMDDCGMFVWSKAYEKKGFQLEFCDFKINDQDEIFVFGLAIEGSGAVLFLMKANQNGEKERFQFFQSETPSHSSFSIDLNGDKILLCGSILEIGSPRTGFFAIFDLQLNFQWANKMTPFTFEGAAILSEHNEIIGRTGAFHYKFDEAGILKWAKQFEFLLDPKPIAGPFELSDGYLFEAYFEDQAFFYKLDPEGQLLWKSDLFISSSFPATICEVANGNMIIHYTAPHGTHNLIHQLTLSSTGEILKQRKLASDHFFNVGSVFQSIQDNRAVTLIGNPDALTQNLVEKTDYLIQFSLQEEETDCFKWIDINDIESNRYFLEFPDVTVTMAPLDMRITLQGDLSVVSIESPFFEICASAPEPKIIKMDTTLPCHINWEVSLPSEDFIWEDNFLQSQRLFQEIGTYLATNDNCTEEIIYEYHLERDFCDCDIFLPNAFSPNGDGSNDSVQLFSNCQVMEIKTLVFDRWGNLIFQSQTLESLWDGTFQQEQANEGVYMMQVRYALLSESGGVQKGTLARDVILIR